MVYLILAVVCILFGIVLYNLLTKNDPYDNFNLPNSILASLVLFLIGFVFLIGFNNHKENKACLEQNYSIIPKIIHIEDSSKKILKYKYNNEEYKMEIDRSKNEFYLPESLLKIEPCDGKIFVKK